MGWFIRETLADEADELVVISLHFLGVGMVAVAIKIITKLFSRAANFLEPPQFPLLLQRHNRKIKQL